MLRKIFIVFLFIFVAINQVNTLNVSEYDVELAEIVKEILNISPPEQPIGEFHANQQPPKHMLELYHRFTAGRRASGETVRSITPNIENSSKDESHSHGSNALTFSISHISSNEEIRLAQLVLRRRRISRHPHPLHRKLLPPPYRVRVFEIVEGKGDGRRRTVPLASIPVPQVTSGGWHSLDITSAVRELLLSSPSSSNAYTLGVRFEAPRSKIISPTHFLDQKDNSSAFLMLFTEETNDVATKPHNIKHSKLTKLQQHIKIKTDNDVPKSEEKDTHVKQRHHNVHHSRKKDKESVFNNNPRRHKNKGLKIHDEEDETKNIKDFIDMNEIKKLKRHRKLFDDLNIKYDDQKESENRLKIKSNLIDELLENSETKRVIRSTDEETCDKCVTHDKKHNKTHRRRSIYDNELPYEKLHIKSHSKTLTTTVHPEVVTESVPEEEEDEKNLIPYPPGMERKKKRKWRRGKKKNHRRTTRLPDEWNKDDWEHHRQMRTNATSTNQTCARRDLVVNFKQLGWSDFVIAPPFFNAHYCAGSCRFPVPQRKRNRMHHKKCDIPVTNHAIIQSLMHYRKIMDDVPNPCCVPHSMSPLTILYLTDSTHVILKNYKSMIVKSCGCH